MTETKRFSLNRNQLKYIVIIAMVIDHIAWKYFPDTEIAGQLMHFIGRLTTPCMCFFVAEGFRYTHSKKRYGIRLFLFALISWLPFVYFETGKLPQLFVNGFDFKVLMSQSVIFTLFMGFCALCFAADEKMNVYLKCLGVIVCMICTVYSDWHVSGVMFVLVFYMFRDDRQKQIVTFAATAAMKVLLTCGTDCFGRFWYQWGILLFVPLLMIYNGEKGSGKAFHKWFFYVFYPVHLLIIGLIFYKI